MKDNSFNMGVKNAEQLMEMDGGFDKMLLFDGLQWSKL